MLLHWIATWFGPELRIALSELAIAALVDLVLTLALVLTGKYGQKFDWRRVPQFLITNLPYVVGVILGAVLVKFFPELRQEYLVAATGLAAYLARDWRAKFTVLTGFKPPDSLKRAS